MIRVKRLPAPAYLDPAKVLSWHDSLCLKRKQYYIDLSQSLQRKMKVPQSGTKAPKRPHADNSHYAHPDVRARLEQMFGFKCAYCEGDVKAVSPQHVEHYRPASRYPGSAYQWKNFLLACPLCNTTYKGDRFPIDPAGNTPSENRRNPCSRTGNGEVPLLLNPCDDHPDQHLSFRNGRAIALSRQGQFTRRICGLNREGLVRSRRDWLKFIQNSAELYLSAIAGGNVGQIRMRADDLREFVYDSSPYASMARIEIQRLGINWRSL